MGGVISRVLSHMRSITVILILSKHTWSYLKGEGIVNAQFDMNPRIRRRIKYSFQEMKGIYFVQCSIDRESQSQLLIALLGKLSGSAGQQRI